MVKRMGLGIVGVTVGTAAMLLSSSAHASRHCIDREIKAAVLGKLGAKGQTTDLAIAGVTLDEQNVAAGEAKGPTVVVSATTPTTKLQVNVASESPVDVLVCVYARDTTAEWRATTSAGSVHGAFGSGDAGNKVLEYFTLEGTQRSASYTFVNAADSPFARDRVVGVVLTPTKGTAKYSIGLNKPLGAAPPPPPPPTGVIGVDRGAFFSEAATARMKEFSSPDGGRCLTAVKRALIDTNTIIAGEDGTREAKDFVHVMRDKTKVRGYREVTQAELKYDYTTLRSLKTRLAVGTVIVYQNNDMSDKKAPSPVHGHVEVVVDYNGQRLLMSDHVTQSFDSWAWLSAKTAQPRKIDMWIFVPTEANHVMVAPLMDLTPPRSTKPTPGARLPRKARPEN